MRIVYKSSFKLSTSSSSIVFRDEEDEDADDERLDTEVLLLSAVFLIGASFNFELLRFPKRNLSKEPYVNSFLLVTGCLICNSDFAFVFLFGIIFGDDGSCGGD